MFNTLQQAATTPLAGVTELVLAQNNQLQREMVLPMLAHLSRQAKDRWISWILPPDGTSDINKETLQNYGFDLSRLRLIHAKDDADTKWILWQALALGNSEVVLASPGKITDRDFRRLEQAAYKGDSQGLLIRYR